MKIASGPEVSFYRRSAKTRLLILTESYNPRTKTKRPEGTVIRVQTTFAGDSVRQVLTGNPVLRSQYVAELPFSATVETLESHTEIRYSWK